MNVVLLAAGLGTRLRPLTDRIPKCMVPINGKPLLDYWLEMLEPIEQISNIYINLHYKQDVVKSHLQRRWVNSAKIHTLEEAELKGTAGTLRALYKDLEGEEVMVIHADNLSRFSLPQFIHTHKSRPDNCAITMMLFESDDPSSCGIVELDQANVVRQMHEKSANPPGKLANGAVYIFTSEVLKAIQEQSLNDISQQVIPLFLGRIFTFFNQTYHRDIGTPRAYALAQSEYPLILTGQ